VCSLLLFAQDTANTSHVPELFVPPLTWFVYSDAELKTVGEYGLKNKREVWRVQLTLSKIRRAARYVYLSLSLSKWEKC
jgi:hypothetical protein